MKKRNLAGKIAHNFVYNRPISILLLLATVFAGVFAYMITPKQYNPEISLPAFQISIEYPGATAQEVENFITEELEEKIADIEGVDKIYSRSIDGGVAILNVEFKVGEDIEESKVKVQSKIAENLDLMQAAMSQPLIKNINPDNVPIITYGFSSDTLSQNEVRKLVIDLMNEVKKVPDVANLEVHGGEKRALRIILDPDRMLIRKVSPEDVKNAILASNIKMPAGKIEDFNSYQSIEVDGTFKDVSDAREIIVIPGVKLSDIADISDDYSEKTSFVKISKGKENQHDAVFLSIAKRKGSNSVTVSENIHQKIDALIKKEEFTSLNYELFRDDGEVASESVNGLFSNLTTSIIIVFLVLLAFLGSRPAIVVAIAIPLTLALTFFVAFLMGETINRISLFALILSLGLLVDSATVIVENIYRHLQNCENKKEAIVNAVDEVGIGLFLSTLTSVIVFLPTSQISGMMGEYMGPLSVFVPIALIMSLLVAYKLTPFLADILLPIPEKNQDCEVNSTDNNEIKNQDTKKSKRKFSLKYFFTWLSEIYGKILTKLLSKKKYQITFLAVTFGLLLLILTFPVLKLVHFKMLPTADKEQFYVYLDAPEATNYTKTQEIVENVNDVLFSDKNVVSVQSFTGTAPVIDFNGLYKSADLRRAPYLATLRVNLTEKDQREIKSEEIVRSIRKKIQDSENLNSFINDGVKIRLIEDPPGPPTQATLQAKVKGPDREMREKIAEDLVEKFQKTDEVVDIYTSREEVFFRTIFTVDHEKALNSGISTYQVANALRTALSPLEISQYHPKNQNEIAFIELQFSKEDRNEMQDLSQIYIKNQMGEMVALESVTKKIDSRNPPVLFRDERDNVTYVNAELGNRSVVYAVIDLIGDLMDYNLPAFQTTVQAQDDSKQAQDDNLQIQDDAVSQGQNGPESWNLFGLNYQDKNGDIYKIEWGGEWKMTLENFRDLGIAMIVAFVLIYAVLVAQFGSFLAPALIMTTIPLGFLGILPGFAVLDAINGTFLTATSLIGFIALMGIVVNNAILYLEYVYILLNKGEGVRKALIEAGKTRLRPILLTSMTTILGTLTIASDPVWSGLAWAIVFGLSLSVVMTLGVFPTLYNLIRPGRK